MFGRESLALAGLAFAISTLSTTATGADMSSTAIKSVDVEVLEKFRPKTK